jgi:hypothetical protein
VTLTPRERRDLFGGLFLGDELEHVSLAGRETLRYAAPAGSPR